VSQIERNIKCLIWDLDNTIWDGILSEDENVQLREEVPDIIRELDNRGILQSIASKNEYLPAVKKLKEFGIFDYFIYPQISWNEKSKSIYNISKLINIGRDTLAFIDDQLYERDEVNFKWPEVLCIEADSIKDILSMPEMIPRFKVPESKNRRNLYQNNIKRMKWEEDFKGTKEEFLASLDMKLTISLVEDNDLKRVEELTIRTHQLNSTGYLYSYEELDAFRVSKTHRLYICELEDIYGTYGKIGLALIEIKHNTWRLKLLLMSCRVMGKGVGSVFLSYLLNLAKKEEMSFQAEFVPNESNRIMYITYKLSGFYDITVRNDFILLGHSLENIPILPKYIKLINRI
jgi:FkbH-like protein